MAEQKRGNVYVYGRGDHPPPSAVRFNVTSHSEEPMGRKLSPFFLGPVAVEPFADGKVYVSQTMENAWQFSKMYPIHFGPVAKTATPGLTLEYNYTKWFEWAKEGWANPIAVRYPMGKGAKPFCSIWKGRSIGYIEARFNIYAPLYAACAERYAPDSLNYMRSILESGRDIALFDFDGYDYIRNGMTLETAIYNEKRKFGHAFVIAGILTGQRVWEMPYDHNKIVRLPAHRS